MTKVSAVRQNQDKSSTFCWKNQAAVVSDPNLNFGSKRRKEAMGVVGGRAQLFCSHTLARYHADLATKQAAF